MQLPIQSFSLFSVLPIAPCCLLGEKMQGKEAWMPGPSRVSARTLASKSSISPLHRCHNWDATRLKGLHHRESVGATNPDQVTPVWTFSYLPTQPLNQHRFPGWGQMAGFLVVFSASRLAGFGFIHTFSICQGPLEICLADHAYPSDGERGSPECPWVQSRVTQPLTIVEPGLRSDMCLSWPVFNHLQFGSDLQRGKQRRETQPWRKRMMPSSEPKSKAPPSTA